MENKDLDPKVLKEQAKKTREELEKMLDMSSPEWAKAVRDDLAEMERQRNQTAKPSKKAAKTTKPKTASATIAEALAGKHNAEKRKVSILDVILGGKG